MAGCRWSCTPEGTRTPNLLVRSQTLYPIELRAQSIFKPLNINEFLFRVKWIPEHFGGAVSAEASALQGVDSTPEWALVLYAAGHYLKRPDTTGTFPSSTIRIRRVRGTTRIVISCFEPGPTVK